MTTCTESGHLFGRIPFCSVNHPAFVYLAKLVGELERFWVGTSGSVMDVSAIFPEQK
jgi:hypothetical protein